MQPIVPIDIPAVLMVFLLAITVAGLVGKRVRFLTKSLSERWRNLLGMTVGVLTAYSIASLAVYLNQWSGPQAMMLYGMTGALGYVVLKVVVVIDIKLSDFR